MSAKIIYNTPEAVYRKHPALNQSFLKSLACPSKAKAELDGLRKKTSSGFKIGSLTHTLFLTPEMFSQKYVVGPDLNKNTKEYKSFKADAQAACLEVIDNDELETAQGVVKSILKNESVKAIISDGFDSEVAIFGEYSVNYCDENLSLKSKIIEAKALVDLIPRNPDFNKCLVDLKTCTKADKDSFMWSIFEYGYHIQASWYLNLANQAELDASTFLVIAAETEPPFDCCVYEIDAKALQRGAEEIERYLAIYARCVESGIWPGYSQEIMSIGLPEKAFRGPL